MNPREFVESFERKVLRTIGEYQLLEKKEKVVVGASGGKDSTALLYLLKRHGYDVKALHIDLRLGEWSRKCLANLEQFCKENGIELHVVDAEEKLGIGVPRLMELARSKLGLSCCSVCGVIKRWLLNREAKQLGAEKLATGHNLDDEAETVMMNLLLGNVKANVMVGPKVGIESEVKGFVQRVKPLYFCSGKETELYCELMGLKINREQCPRISSFRLDVRRWLNILERENPGIKLKLVKQIMKWKQELAKHVKSKLVYCKLCGEPSSSEICKTCKLLLACGEIDGK